MTEPVVHTGTARYSTDERPARVFESSLREGIPYTTSAVRPYDRREIKDAVAYLRIIANPFHLWASSVINNPPRGKATFDKVPR